MKEIVPYKASQIFHLESHYVHQPEDPWIVFVIINMRTLDQLKRTI